MTVSIEKPLLLQPVKTFALLRDVFVRLDADQMISVAGQSDIGIFYFNQSSLDADDGINIIKPNSIDSSEPGRWISMTGGSVGEATLPIPDEYGQILYAATADAFTKQIPVVEENGYIVVDVNGRIVSY